MKKHKGLGRGLESFFKETFVSEGFSNSDSDSESIIQCPIESLVPGKYQPRTIIDQDALEELATSIRAYGLMNPIVVRPREGSCYEIIAGERRWRASKLAGMGTVPIVVRDVPDSVVLPLAIIENVQRESLTPIDQARAIKRLLDEFGMTHQQVSDSIGRSRTAVTNLLRLLSLHPGAIQLLQDGCFDVGHARALLALPSEDQFEVARHIIDKNLSVRQAEAVVRNIVNGSTNNRNKFGIMSDERGKMSADAHHLQERLSDLLCAAVSVQCLTNGSFRLTIQYDNLDQLDDFLTRVSCLDTNKVTDRY
ncbi:MULTISPECIES: ParB/RepB/Spo0J family partition protein [Candidatus Ichthyocystis]|uniref:Chromosome-partitioning protein ParB n=1 Tax=Candidatus Ichthyocystis hellenicum TaxID=1561003 RepID=A0A0S4M4D3_9BURK|nr:MULTISPECIES: ParB/RepB/Spo0J family partition protein [Ichthyocystis]CUT17133.1 chromosome-partitioning protein ParB [Candidatus Ichthyocystis hellenicum]